MSTTPLTIVDGAMALPRSRPFDDVPAPFGRSWTLLAQDHRLDARLHVLYGAVLETFSFSDQPIRSFCRWVVPENRRADATAAATNVGAAIGMGMPGIVGGREAKTSNISDSIAWLDRVPAHDPGLAGVSAFANDSAFPDVFAPVEGHVARSTPRSSFAPRWVLAGGVCALSGTALLAWAMYGHVGVHDPRNRHEAKSADTAIAGRAAPTAQNRLSDTVDASQKVVEAASRKNAGAASLPQLAQAAPVSGLARNVVVSDLASRARPTASIEPHVPTSIAHTRSPLAVNKHRHRTRERHLARTAAANHRQYSADYRANYASNYAATIAAPPPITQTLIKPSAAGPYSPLAPALLGTDDYASVDTIAHTHHGSTIQQTPPASSAHLSAGSGQQWIDRVTHRRVTEVPDQFAR
ncbi:hypothetical protein [Paraburkholderia dilworthii]|uniref:hypothetical protein n=1 Tax=Paraburkholderia dilworthii TaxID=948106 RepID=UPI000411F179|nr:hypothetical protein [Paraburkholderia dilworthii]